MKPYLVLSLNQLRQLVKIAERKAVAHYGKKAGAATLVLHPVPAEIGDGQINDNALLLEAEAIASESERLINL